MTQDRLALIKSIPCFEKLSTVQAEELLSLMDAIHFSAKENIVIENDIIDSVYIILQGEAEVKRLLQFKKKTRPIVIATLSTGDSIGLNETGFFSTTGRRTASVIAMTDVNVLKLDIKKFNEFLIKHNLQSNMIESAQQMLRMNFIKHSLPFSNLSSERIQWLAEHLEEKLVSANEIIFQEGEAGDKCYLIEEGQVEISRHDEDGKVKVLSVLKPPIIFGEATLITGEKRNATAKALTNCKLLVLHESLLTELLESDKQVTNMFMSLMIDRSRPIQVEDISLHQRQTADGQTISILKNPNSNSYFKLSKEGMFIWQQLDGQHTLQDITLSLADKYNVFAPDLVVSIIAKLSRSGFIENLEITDYAKLNKQPLWVRAITKIRNILEIRVALGDVNPWLTKYYQRIFRYCFTTPAQIILILVAITGFVLFISETKFVLNFFKHKHISLLLLLTLIPLSVVKVFLHELGHAFAVKAFGRDVHYIGIGWYWVSPMAFTDTSDMWLAARKPRMLVNIAGVYVDSLVAGISALLAIFVHNPYVQAMLWLFALYTYIGGLNMLSPLAELDGYYILMDWLEKPRLRQNAVVWLIKKFPQSIRQPKLFKQNLPEVWYWLISIIYIILITIITLVIQAFVFSILGLHSVSPYLTLIIPLLVVVFSCLTIIADIKNQAEN